MTFSSIRITSLDPIYFQLRTCSFLLSKFKTKNYIYFYLCAHEHTQDRESHVLV